MRSFWVISVALSVWVSFAQQPGGPGFGSGPGGGRGRGMMIGFTALDANADGTLSADEIAGASSALAKLDKNSDGQLTADDIRVAMPERRGPGGPDFGRREGRGEGRGEGRSERRGGPEGGPAGGDVVEETVKTLMAFDANGDGKLSRTELPERMRGIFDRADEDKDGVLTTAEIRKHAQASAPAPRGGSGGFRGRGEGFPPNFIRMDPILAAVDSNGDGAISAEELRNASKALRTLDSDGDGTITREEAITTARRNRPE